MVSLGDFIRQNATGVLEELARRPDSKVHEKVVRQDHLRADGIEKVTTAFRVFGPSYPSREVWVNGWSRDESEVAAIEAKLQQDHSVWAPSQGERTYSNGYVSVSFKAEDSRGDPMSGLEVQIGYRYGNPLTKETYLAQATELLKWLSSMLPTRRRGQGKTAVFIKQGGQPVETAQPTKPEQASAERKYYSIEELAGMNLYEQLLFFQLEIKGAAYIATYDCQISVFDEKKQKALAVKAVDFEPDKALVNAFRAKYSKAPYVVADDGRITGLFDSMPQGNDVRAAITYLKSFLTSSENPDEYLKGS